MASLPYEQHLTPQRIDVKSKSVPFRIFFVISGYVITMSLERGETAPLFNQIRAFYTRRIKRLLPALLTMLVLSSMVIPLIDASDNVKIATAITSVFGASNIFLFIQSVNYFGESAQLNTFNHTWSLGVEEQFYVLYPFLMRLGVRGKGTNWLRLAALGALSVASLVLFTEIYGKNQPAAYYLMPCRFWELGIGCLLALGHGAYVDRTGPFFRTAAVAGSGALLIAALALAQSFPTYCTMAAALAAAGLIAFVRPGNPAYGLLSHRFSVYLGRISYSLYLWHWPVIWVSRWTIGIHWWTLPFQIAAIGVLSAASFHFIENPLRRAVWPCGQWGPIGLGLTAMVLTAGGLYASLHYQWPPFTGARAAQTAAVAPEPGYTTKWSHRNVSDCFAVAVFVHDPNAARRNADRCSALVDGKPKLLFVGDSHATDLMPMADQLYHDGVASVVNISQPGCRVPATTKEPDYCAFPNFLNVIKGNKNNILVFRDNYSPRRIDGDLGQFSNILQNVLNQTHAAGMRVVYIAPAPKYYKVAGDSLCSEQWFRPKWALSESCRQGLVEDRGEELARVRDMTDLLFAVSRKRNDFFVFDPFDVLCGRTDGFCSPIRNGQLIYRDDSHLTEAGSISLARPFEAFLRAHHLLDQER